VIWTSLRDTPHVFPGLPLQQSITVFPDDGDLLAEREVKFVVTNFVAGQMDCKVWESEVPGYIASYESGTIGSSSRNRTVGGNGSTF